MSLKKEIEGSVSTIFSSEWNVVSSDAVPDPEDVGLGNKAKLIDATVLYADLEDSTGLIAKHKQEFCAEVIKSFLESSCRVIRGSGGSITSFDGDRVMAIFCGSSKNSTAVKAALKINYVVQSIINPAIRKQYPSLDYQVKHVVGIDSSKVLSARAGIRRNNDLVWISSAANEAAKMSAIRRTGYRTIISRAVYSRLNLESRMGGSPEANMWTEFYWPDADKRVYGSNWSWDI